MSMFFLGSNILHICTALFSATQNTKLQKSTEFVRLASTLALMAGIFFLDIGNLVLYAWIWILGVLIAILFAGFFAYQKYYIIYLKNIPTEKDVILRKDFIKYAIPTFLTANISLILSQIDAQLVTGILGNEAQGLYSNYLSIMTLPFIVIAPIMAFLFPVFTELHSRGNTEKILFLYKNLILYFAIIAIWVSFFLFQTGKNWAEILFGASYIESGIILQYSVPFLIFNILNQLNFQLLAGTGHAWSRTISFAIVLPINIALNIFLIPKLGVEGSALAVGLSWIPLYLLTLYSSRKYISLPPIWPIILNIIAVVEAYFLGKIITENGNFSSGNSLLIMIGIYGIFFILINFSTFKNALQILKTHRS